MVQMLIVLLLLFILLPVLIMFICYRYPFFNKIGPVVIAYIVGLVIGNSGLLPPEGIKFQHLLSNITIPIAIPLMLFSINLRLISGLAGRHIKSLFAGLVSVIVIIVTGYFIFENFIPDAWKVSGLLVGVYTGGTPNLASLKLILNVDENLYLVIHSADLVVGVFYLFFLMTLGQRFFSRFLPVLKTTETGGGGNMIVENNNDFEIFKKKYFISHSKSLLLALAVIFLSVALSLFVPKGAQMAVIMMLITTFALALSFIPQINKMPKTFELGMYFVLVFSVTVASKVYAGTIISVTFEIIGFVVWVVFGSLILQVVLSRILKIDVDTMIITSAALVCSPPFVPVVAGALKNRNIVLTGLTIGILGYAIGNYLGFLLANWLKLF